MKSNNLWIWILVIFALLILASVFRDKIAQVRPSSSNDEYKTIQKYLLNDSPLYGYNKPKIWIHSKYEVNARKWQSFLSPNSTDLNQPYLYLTIQSIVNHCGTDFHICLIDDDSFEQLLPSWKYEPLSTLADPIKTELRELAFMKLVYFYGGIVVPDSFLCMRSLNDLYQSTKYKPCIGEKLNRTLTQTDKVFVPSPYFMAAHKNAPVIQEWIEWEEKQFEDRPFTTVSAEQAVIMRPICASRLVQDEKVKTIDGQYLGIKTPQGKPIQMEDLLSENYLDLNPKTYGIYLPADEILARKSGQWFAVMSQEEILMSNMIIAKYFMAAAIGEEDKKPSSSNIHSATTAAA